MKLRMISVAALCGISLIAGCSSSADYDASKAPVKDDSTKEVPRWIRDGVKIARLTLAKRNPAPTDVDRSVAPILPTSDPTALPSRDIVVGALTGAGLTAEQAGCMYDAISASPQTTGDVAAILQGLAGATAAPASAGTAASFDPASIPALSTLTPESINRLLLAVAPCLDQATLLSLLAAGQGLGNASGTDAIAALLGSAQGMDLSKLAGFDPDAIAKAAAGALGSEQVKQLTALLAAVGTAPTNLATNPLLGFDVTKLDLSKLTEEQMPLLVLALMKGLTAEQQGQLSQLAQVKLDELDIKVDPDELTPEEIGTLLLILSPLLAGAIRTTPVTPPAGADPNQVYIPPGADLSNMNPLIFLNRADVIAQFSKQGIDPNFGGCLFDAMARMEPSTIAAFFSTDAGPSAAGAVILVAVSCLAQNR